MLSLNCGIAGSNPAEGMDVRLLSVLCVVSEAFSATSWSLVLGSPAKYVWECVCVCVCVCVWSRNFNNEAAYGQVELFHHRKKNMLTITSRFLMILGGNTSLVINQIKFAWSLPFVRHLIWVKATTTVQAQSCVRSQQCSDGCSIGNSLQRWRL